jgi:ribonuclease BN (tRNA processing enzyme)
MIKNIYFQNRLAKTTRTVDEPVRIFGPAANGAPFPGTTIPQYPDTSAYADGYYAMPNGVERYLNLFATAITGDIPSGPSKFAYTTTDLPSNVAGTIAPVIVVDEGGLLITAIPVDHGPVPAVAYRIDYKGHSIVYSGDTGTHAGKANMIAIADNADLLIYDTAVTNEEPAYGLFHVLHTNPSLMGEVASAADVKKLVLSHITVITDPRLDIVKDEIKAAGYSGKIKAASDLKVYNLGDD